MLIRHCTDHRRLRDCRAGQVWRPECTKLGCAAPWPMHHPQGCLADNKGYVGVPPCVSLSTCNSALLGHGNRRTLL